MNPATDGLREAIQTKVDALEQYAADGILSFGIAAGWREGVRIAVHNLREVLAAHPAPPSETAPEGVERVEWGFRFEDGEVRWSPSLTEQHVRAMPRTGSELVRRTITEFAPIVGEWEPVEETQE